MPLKNKAIQNIRPLLFPISFLAGLYIRFRNYLYTINFKKSAEFSFPIICIGNLSVGGTGKSPMVEYCLKLLLPSYQTAVLSRGYKRKTKGYLMANKQTTALEIGDEPMQFHLKFPEASIAVGEERVVTIPLILQDKPDTEVIILDDAFQHRKIKAGLNILLTEYSNPYWKDHYLPMGDLRDEPASAKRAEVIIVTKCPSNIKIEEQQSYLKHINPLPTQHVFFAAIAYAQPHHLFQQTQNISLQKSLYVLLITGIANPAPLHQYLNSQIAGFQEITYNDHHIFSIDDLRHIKKTFAAIKDAKKIIITTEKDAVRLKKFGDELSSEPIYVLPVSHQILFNQQQQFEKIIVDFVQNFSVQTTTNTP